MTWNDIPVKVIGGTKVQPGEDKKIVADMNDKILIATSNNFPNPGALKDDDRLTFDSIS